MKKIALTFALSVLSASAFAYEVINHKSPYCGCCSEWSKHMAEQGFTVKDVLHDNMNPIKQQLGITPEIASCHTAEIEGYVFEGHIPAQDIKDFLANPPKNALGLAAPGMPIGAPGMEMDGKAEPYTVYAFNEKGQTMTFRQH